VAESALVLPQVATISRPIQEMCRHVVRVLLELLAGRECTDWGAPPARAGGAPQREL